MGKSDAVELINSAEGHTSPLQFLSRLAVVNLSKMQSFIPQNEKQVTAVDAQLVSMESYINPDVSEALRFRKRHQDMLGASVVAELPMPDEETSGDAEPVSSTGIALFQVSSQRVACFFLATLLPPAPHTLRFLAIFASR